MKPILEDHNRRKKNGLSVWYIRTPRRRRIELQSFKGRLYLYGALISRSHGHLKTLIRFESSIGEIKRMFGEITES